MSFWNVVWLIVISFAFLAYLMVLGFVIVDVFHDRSTSGVAKATWIVLLIFLPVVTAVLYLLVRGGALGERPPGRAQTGRAG